VITDLRHVSIGVDTGGTFTDLVACADDGTIVAADKVSTTTDDPSRAILDGLRRSGTSNLDCFLHGTTTATNALLERGGARTGLITTRGFRDVLALARQDRPGLYDWFRTKPEPLAERRLTVEVDERVTVNGDEGRPLDTASAVAAIRTLSAIGAESIAVSLLHAYRDGRNELRLAELIERELPGMHVSLSSEVMPEIGEYERTATTVANAYLAPVLGRYLERLLSGLRAAGISAPAYVMQSNGGLGLAESVAARAVETVLSGPAAGVIGGLAAAGGGGGTPDLLTIDMGGTSFDVAYAEGRNPVVSRETKIAGLPIGVPALEIHTLGAGGGSIAWIDSGGLLNVGPQSAGSSPGPACYGLGGDEATVTDANLVLGRLGPELVGGELKLDPDAAHRAIERRIASRLGLPVIEAARGIVDVANAAMAKGMHLMSVARGRDPRLVGVVAFGGAGPLHACELAELVGNRTVIVPLLPGNTSALGLTLADVRRERSTAVLAPLAELGSARIDAILEQLGSEVRRLVVDDGADAAAVIVKRFARISYEGQRYQIGVPLPPDWSPESAAASFQERHLAHYGYSRREALWLGSLDVVGLAPIRGVKETRLGPGVVDKQIHDPYSRRAWFAGDLVETPVLARWGLRPDDRVEGPAILEQADTTIVIPPGWSGSAAPDGTLHLVRG
jgi:N-methylhydantoinase A